MDQNDVANHVYSRDNKPVVLKFVLSPQHATDITIDQNVTFHEVLVGYLLFKI